MTSIKPSSAHKHTDAPDTAPIIDLQIDHAYLLDSEQLLFKSQDGFTGNNTVPERIAASANEWARRLLEATIRTESEDVKRRAKQVFGLRRRDVERTISESGATVECKFFIMTWDVGQHPENPAQILVTRSIELRCSVTELPANWDDIFTCNCHAMFIPFRSAADYDDVADRFEDICLESGVIKFDEYEDERTIELTFPDTTQVLINMESLNLIIRNDSAMGVKDMLHKATNQLRLIYPRDKLGRLA